MRSITATKWFGSMPLAGLQSGVSELLSAGNQYSRLGVLTLASVLAGTWCRPRRFLPIRHRRSQMPCSYIASRAADGRLPSIVPQERAIVLPSSEVADEYIHDGHRP